MSFISVKNMSLSFDQNIVLNDVTFSIEKGKIYALIGNNGAGKSSIAKILMGLLEKKSGDIYVDGVLLNDKNIEEIRKSFAFVFQNPDNQFIGNTVAEDVAFKLENEKIEQSEMDKYIDRALNNVNMLDYKSVAPSNLSGGQKQRVAFASSSVLPVKFLILDESTSMLDPKGREDISNLIKDFKKQNKDLTILMITHNMEEVLLADHVLYIKDKRVYLVDSLDDLFLNDELLKEIKIEKPFIYKIKEYLNKNKSDIDTKANISEIGDTLCRLK